MNGIDLDKEAIKEKERERKAEKLSFEIREKDTQTKTKDIAFILVILTFAVALFGTSLYYEGELQKTEQDLNSANNSLSGYKKDGFLFFNHLQLQHNLVGATDYNKILTEQSVFASNFFGTITLYNDINININLNKLNECYKELDKIKKENGDVDSNRMKCLQIEDQLNERLYVILLNRHKDKNILEPLGN